MSTIAGYFDETIMNDIRVKASEIMFDDRIKQQFIPKYNVVNAVSAVQTARVFPNLKNSKDFDVEVIWENFCDYECEANVSCEVGGTKSSTNLETYAMTFVRQVVFSFDEQDFIDNDFSVNVAKGMLKADKELTECFAQYAVAQIDSFAGNNAVTTGKGVVVGADTFIAAHYWNAALVSYFNRVGIMNRFTNPIMLSGNNLFEQVDWASYTVKNANDKADYYAFGDMNLYFDLFNVDTVNDPDLNTYLISMGALAMGSRAWNPSTPERLDPFTRYKMPSRFLPGFEYDVFYNTECTTNDLVQHNFKVKLQADVWNNPHGCEEHNTGVLSFTCGESS